MCCEVPLRFCQIPVTKKNFYTRWNSERLCSLSDFFLNIRPVGLNVFVKMLRRAIPFSHYGSSKKLTITSYRRDNDFSNVRLFLSYFVCAFL